MGRRLSRPRANVIRTAWALDPWAIRRNGSGPGNEVFGRTLLRRLNTKIRPRVGRILVYLIFAPSGGLHVKTGIVSAYMVPWRAIVI